LGNKIEKGTLLALIQQADWDDIYPRAIKYALSKLSFRSGSPRKGNPEQDEAECLVNEAIKKIIESCAEKKSEGPTKGIRKWDPERGPLLDYLISVIRSDISHLYESQEYKLTSRLPVSSHHDDDIEPIETEELLNKAHNLDNHAAYIGPDSPQLADDALIEKETCNYLLEVVKGDDELENVVLCMLYGFSKNRDISEQLRVEVRDINNAKKRLRRAYQGVLKGENKETS